MHRIACLAVLPLLLAACEDDTFPRYPDAAGLIDARIVDAYPRPDAATLPDAAATSHQYIMQTFHYPGLQAEISTYGVNLDCDADGAGHDCTTSDIDNQLGEILDNFRSLGGLEAQAAMDAAMTGGQIIQLFHVNDAPASPDFSRVWLGADTDGNPADNFSGAETFTISGLAAYLPTTIAAGHIAAGCRPDGDVLFDISPLRYQIKIALVAGRAPITLEVLGTFKATYSAAGMIDGVLAGGIPAQQVTDVLIPELYFFVNDLLTRADCDPTCMIYRNAHRLFWDTSSPKDGVVTPEEFAANTLFSLDLDLLDNEPSPGPYYDPYINDGTVDHLSFGFGFSATTAVFTAP